MTERVVTPDMLALLSPLARLGTESLSQAGSLAKLETFKQDKHALNFDWAHRVVYLLNGELKVVFPDGRIRVFVGGCDEALLPLTGSGRPPLSAMAITDVDLLWFDENAIDILFTWDQVAPPALSSSQHVTEVSKANWRSMSGFFDARQLTRGTFASLPPAHIESLLSCFRRQPVKAGEVIVRQNAPGNCYYVIERGRAQVTREVSGACIELAELDSGDAFGEEALIAGTQRNATVTMKTDGELLCLDGADFARLLRAPLLRSIDADRARALITGGGWLWLDVRFPAEFKSDGLPGAINIPLNELRDALPSLRKDREYIVYCQSGRRSSAAAFLLSQRGFHATLLEGGIRQLAGMERAVA
jgi:rhodanese-related sulfurtransferase